MIHVNKLNLTIPGVRQKRFLHISDAHVTSWGPGDSPEYVDYMERYSRIWGTEGRTANENFEDFLMLARQTRPDALTIAGDLMEAYSVSNIRYLVNALKDFPVEYHFAYGNHEPEAMAAEGLGEPLREEALRAGLAGRGPAFWVRDFGDLLLIGVDNADRTVAPERLALLEEQLDRGIPTLVVMHVPLPLPTFAPTVRQTYDDYDYYLFGYPQPTELTERFYKALISPSSPVCGILAGHVHFVSKTEYAPGRCQITAAPGFGWEVAVNSETGN